jgi:P pilus assembly chaperone PapD
MMSRNRHITAGLLAILLPLLAQAGVVVNGTRFIYSGGAKEGMSVILKNTGADRYLIQSKITPYSTTVTSGSEIQRGEPFISTPPLFAMNGYGENVVRILRVGGELPEDRESVFSLSIAAIPSGKPEANTVQWAVRTRYKLFYRPEGLKGNPQHAYRQLKWTRQGNQVSAYNPTPYYVTLFGVQTNGEAHPDAGMVPPFTSRTWSWCSISDKCELKWQGIDDYGAVLAIQQRCFGKV